MEGEGEVERWAGGGGGGRGGYTVTDDSLRLQTGKSGSGPAKLLLKECGMKQDGKLRGKREGLCLCCELPPQRVVCNPEKQTLK